ncbi:hypothetical protein [Helicobacter sp. T3_23-1056]
MAIYRAIIARFWDFVKKARFVAIHHLSLREVGTTSWHLALCHIEALQKPKYPCK